MKKLLEFILLSITGSNECTVAEQVEEGEHVSLVISAPQEIIGLIIGKGGKTIKAIRNIIKVRATLEKKGVSVSIADITPSSA
jgi:predicted RNA-binding protein YlqC (UPF0109 family)